MRPHVGTSIPESNASARLPGGLRARLWIAARHLYSRADAQDHAWLWLHRLDGRVQVLRVQAQWLGRDEVLGVLLAALDAGEVPSPASSDAPLATGNEVHAFHLPDAPVVPVLRWSVSWGHPLQRTIRDFAARLDLDVLLALGELEVPGPFVGTAANYNRLVALDVRTRSHRLQALALFPPLVAPVLLDVLDRPDLFGDRRGGEGIRSRAQPRAETLDAIDRGRDLIGALAAHHRVDRALVRAPLCRTPWATGAIPAEALRLIAAIPAQARPRHAAEVEPRLALLEALPFTIRRDHEVHLLARSFMKGWNATWAGLEAIVQPLHAPLRNTRDFLDAALEQAPPSGSLPGLSREGLGLAWTARRGLESLLRASMRWHAQPLEDLPAAEPPAPTVVLLPALVVGVPPDTIIEELLTEAQLVEEGERMHHCVADYWDDCLRRGTRIVRIEIPGGERATAEYTMICGAPGLLYSLEQVLGPCNAPVSSVMKLVARAFELRMNLPEMQARRERIAQMAIEADAQARNSPMLRRTIRRLDAQSRRELARVLDWCEHDDGWKQRRGELYFGALAGFQHADGARLLHHLRAGDALTLVREPTNPYDHGAVRVDWRGTKLGYIPRARNTAVAQSLDAGAALVARIVAVSPGADSWSQVELLVEYALAGSAAA